MSIRILSLLILWYGWVQVPISLYAQADSSALHWSAYLETYYSFDLAKPADHLRPDFFYNFNRHNEVNLNLGFLKASYNSINTRANLALMSGTYAQYNLAAEPSILQHLFEANAGVKLSSTHELWLDAGLMPSHIGFESAIGKDCWTLSRSLLAENSPYYETGARLSYASPDSRWFLAAFYLNGWQRIQRVDGHQTPAFGTQATYKTAAGTTFNWSTFLGNEMPVGSEQWRFFNNFYAVWSPTASLGLTAGFDLGWQQQPTSSQAQSWWYSPVLILRYQLTPKWAAATRLEYYSDPASIIVKTTSPNEGFEVMSFSLNLDYAITPTALLRVEGRGLHSPAAIFETAAGQPVQQNFFLTTSLAVSWHD